MFFTDPVYQTEFNSASNQTGRVVDTIVFSSIYQETERPCFLFPETTYNYSYILHVKHTRIVQSVGFFHIMLCDIRSGFWNMGRGRMVSCTGSIRVDAL